MVSEHPSQDRPSIMRGQSLRACPSSAHEVAIVTRRNKLKTAIFLFTVATVAYSIRSKKSHGRFLGVPFDWRLPSLGEVRQKLWNPADDRLFTPTTFGIGWVPNAHQLLQRLGYLGGGPRYAPAIDDADGPDASDDGDEDRDEDDERST